MNAVDRPGCERRHDEDAPKGGQPGQEGAEVVAGGGEDGVGGVAVRAFEEVASQPVLVLGVADDGFDRRAAAQVAFDGVGNAVSLAGDVDLEPLIGGRVVAAIAAVGDDAREARADLRLPLRT